MRAILGLLCYLTLTCNAPADAETASTRDDKRASAAALLSEISGQRSGRQPDGLPDGLARAVAAWTGEGAGEE